MPSAGFGAVPSSLEHAAVRRAKRETMLASTRHACPFYHGPTGAIARIPRDPGERTASHWVPGFLPIGDWNATCFVRIFRGHPHFRSSFAVLICVASVAPPARGQVTQTGDNTPLPQAVGQPEIQLSMDLGWRENTPVHQDLTATISIRPGVYRDFFPTFRNGDAVKLSGLFKWRKEQIDERPTRAPRPATFQPTCGFTAELVLRGGDCNVQFGWYNVTDPNNPTPPAPNEIYPLVPAEHRSRLELHGSERRTQARGIRILPARLGQPPPLQAFRQLAWIPKPYDSGEIKTATRVQGRLRRLRADRQPEVAAAARPSTRSPSTTSRARRHALGDHASSTSRPSIPTASTSPSRICR